MSYPDYLPVYIITVPGVGKLDVGICFKHTNEESSLQDDSEMDAAECGGNEVWSKLHSNGGLIAVSPEGGGGTCVRIITVIMVRLD